tara:strand:+ start:70 stop:510 length:441 start_codon:yes stop_codon:yes gene_type:complete
MRSDKSITNDLIMGKKNEQKFLKYLNEADEYEDKQFKVYKNQFSTFDFVNNDTIAELKSRRVRCQKFHDTMVGYNKLKVCNPKHINHIKDKKYVFYFLFRDGLFKWDYCDKFSVRWYFHKDKQKWEEYGYIPIADLELVCPSLTSL